MLPYHLRRLFNEFGHRMQAREAWRGDLLIQRGLLTVEQLRTAVVEGYLTPLADSGLPARHWEPMPINSYLRAGLYFAGRSCFYRLTPLGWLTGIAIGATFTDPRAEVVELGDTSDSKSDA